MGEGSDDHDLRCLAFPAWLLFCLCKSRREDRGRERPISFAGIEAKRWKKVSGLRVAFCVVLILAAEAAAFYSATLAWLLAATAGALGVRLIFALVQWGVHPQGGAVSARPYVFAAVLSLAGAGVASFADALTRAFPALVKDVRWLSSSGALPARPLASDVGGASSALPPAFASRVATMVLRGDSGFSKGRWLAAKQWDEETASDKKTKQVLSFPLFRFGETTLVAIPSRSDAIRDSALRLTLQLQRPGLESQTLLKNAQISMVRGKLSQESAYLAWWRWTPEKMWVLESVRVPAKTSPGSLPVAPKRQALGDPEPWPLAIAFSQEEGTILVRDGVKSSDSQGWPLLVDVVQGRAPASKLLDAVEEALGASPSPSSAHGDTKKTKEKHKGARAWKLDGKDIEEVPHPAPVEFASDSVCDGWHEWVPRGAPGPLASSLCGSVRVSPSGNLLARATEAGVQVEDGAGNVLGVFPFPRRVKKNLTLLAFPRENEILLAPASTASESGPTASGGSSHHTLHHTLQQAREGGTRVDPWAQGPLTASARALFQKWQQWP